MELRTLVSRAPDRILSGDGVVDASSVLVAVAFHAVPLISVHGPLLSGPLV
jgi:hypothetical protein